MLEFIFFTAHEALRSPERVYFLNFPRFVSANLAESGSYPNPDLKHCALSISYLDCKNLIPVLMLSILIVDYWLQLDEYSNRVANCLLAAGFKHGQSIALFMENRLVPVVRIRASWIWFR